MVLIGPVPNYTSPCNGYQIVIYTKRFSASGENYIIRFAIDVTEFQEFDLLIITLCSYIYNKSNFCIHSTQHTQKHFNI